MSAPVLFVVPAFGRFIETVGHNFASDAAAWELIDSAEHCRSRKAAICAAIGHYREERVAWQAALGQP